MSTAVAEMIDNPLARIVNRNLIRYAVQREIFCQSCGTILDYRKAALITITAPHGTNRHLIICKDCDQQHSDNLQAAARREGCKVEILRLYRPKRPIAYVQLDGPGGANIPEVEARKAKRMAESYRDKWTGNLFGKGR